MDYSETRSAILITLQGRMLLNITFWTSISGYTYIARLTLFNVTYVSKTVKNSNSNIILENYSICINHGLAKFYCCIV